MWFLVWLAKVVIAAGAVVGFVVGYLWESFALGLGAGAEAAEKLIDRRIR